jgi:hypothetical protein
MRIKAPCQYICLYHLDKYSMIEHSLGLGQGIQLQNITNLTTKIQIHGPNYQGSNAD